MSEKESENKLYELLKVFNQDFLYYSIYDNEILKFIFKNASKISNGCGLPDRIYFDNKTLIIFECKSNKCKLISAINDLKIYKNKLNLDKDYNVFYVAFISEFNYKIFNNDFIEINKKINSKTFNLEDNNYNMNITEMENKIHSIHNYIRDNLKLSNEDKPFFIGIILISFKKENFYNRIQNLNTTEFIYDILKDNLIDFDLDISVFEFLRNDKNNDKFYNLIIQVKEIYDRNPSLDLLNSFYSEFVKYGNNDSKSLGIVLTPDHIIKLMVKLLNLNKDDIVLDLCTGTGSFLLESNKFNVKKLIGVEYQNKLYNLLKCNLIVRDIKNYEIFKDDCFNLEYKCTKSIINPPYSVNTCNEWNFILKQIDSMDEGGIACSIIPIGKLTSNKSNNKFKKILLDQAIVKKIIICNKKLFYPIANIQTCIILIEKRINESNMTSIIDYVDDGIDLVMNRGSIKNDTFQDKFNNCFTNVSLVNLKYDTNWSLYENNNILDTTDDNILRRIELLKLEEIYNREREIIKNKLYSNIKSQINKEFILSDLFIVKNIKTPLKLNIKYNTGSFPLISATKFNNGIKCFIEEQQEKYLENGNVLIISTVGTCFYQKDNFYGTSSIKILQCKKKLTESELIKISIVITDKYLEKYNKSRGFKFEIIKDNKILL